MLEKFPFAGNEWRWGSEEEVMEQLEELGCTKSAGP